jgi:hypothetical protein
MMPQKWARPQKGVTWGRTHDGVAPLALVPHPAGLGMAGLDSTRIMRPRSALCLWDNRRMCDEPLRMKWWLVVVAAVVAALVLTDAVGYLGGAFVVALCFGGWAVYRLKRRIIPVKGPLVRCLRCGESLALTARDCPYCGSASWTVN